MKTLNRSRLSGIAFTVLFLACPWLAMGQQNPSFTAIELREHIRFLASDSLEGRAAGSPGEAIAGEYIAADFLRSGLEPLGDNGTFFQGFEFVAGVKLGQENTATIASGTSTQALSLNEEYRPLGFSSSDSFSGSVVFAGYGISMPEKGYDDYSGVDVAGKAVILLRYHPEGDNPHSEFTMVSGLRYKAAKAKEMGAAAMLMVTGPADTDRDGLNPLTDDQAVGNAGIPALSMTQQAVNALLKQTGENLNDLQNGINASKKPNSFLIRDVELQVTVTLDEIRRTGRNVIGYLPGKDGDLNDQVVIIGAHYDHLGMGGQGSGSLTPDMVAVHNGADDNASGTAGLLELAEYFAARRDQLKRSMLFLAFSGEERGLLGSAHYVKNPALPLEHSVVMINMDMIGRLQERKLIVYGMGTSPGFEKLVRSHNADSTFDLRLLPDGFGPSDHSSFYGNKIPVFHFFTDLHSDYHKPTDDWNLINYEGTKDVLELVAAVATDLNDQPDRPVYAEVESPGRPSGDGRAIRSYTGTIPDFGEQVKGMRLSGVTDGSPAAVAGLQAGDVIIKFGKVEINNLYDYTYALGEHKPGDKVELVVRRGDEVKTFRLTVGRRNR